MQCCSVTVRGHLTLSHEYSVPRVYLHSVQPLDWKYTPVLLGSQYLKGWVLLLKLFFYNLSVEDRFYILHTPSEISFGLGLVAPSTGEKTPVIMDVNNVQEKRKPTTRAWHFRPCLVIFIESPGCFVQCRTGKLPQGLEKTKVMWVPCTLNYMLYNIWPINL